MWLYTHTHTHTHTHTFSLNEYKNDQLDLIDRNAKIFKYKVYSKSDRAITLIALIVTIIVLLLLAGVTIANVVGNQGVIKKAKVATNNYDTQSANEEMELFLNGLGNDVTGDRLVDYLKKYVGNDGLEDFQNNGDGTVQLVLNGKNIL